MRYHRNRERRTDHTGVQRVAVVGESARKAICTLFLCISLLSGFIGSSPVQATVADTSSQEQYSPAVQDSITRLYLAVFNRAPDRNGLRYWTQLYTESEELFEIAEYFMVSPEWNTRYLDEANTVMADDIFVDLLYRNILKRSSDVNGKKYWIQELQKGIPRSTILLGFSESPEFILRTQTTSPQTPERSHFPSVPNNAGEGRRIIYSNYRQRVWLMNHDNTVHDSYLISGRKGVPSPGQYRVFSKSPKAWAGHDGITMNHMVRFAHGTRLAIGFHSIPTYRSGNPLQTLRQLGTFLSAGCVRQDPIKAEALYEWADIGTNVIVVE